ncbi:3-phosphoshikimate 1-carboxyvinyltransferase [Fervidobacterium thailandense]|uniref:3-phosphoshikimate 1-carboxyvinyltransferase n=1 Tax=Fervidobacterium thailandense TaxID=1008305 RepID=A0A1E3G1A1_9BACT|nr:3-phosphoshikimate 1-carboxyvinyltransferase [Fervidobacterium thailandense]ODN30017.1 hypothetical protein A4H02_07510 [Fervidobacterium thailandense]
MLLVDQTSDRAIVVPIKIDAPVGRTVTFTAPPSKSQSIRAIFASLLSVACCEGSGEVRLRNVSSCEDASASLEVAKAFGVKITESHSGDGVLDSRDVMFSSPDSGASLRTARPSKLECGESGLCARMVLPILGLFGDDTAVTTVTGRGSLLKRPFDIVAGLKAFGLLVETNAGYLPVNVSGRLRAAHGRIDASLTSQLLSGLLMALPLTDGDSTVIVENPTSKPYIAMTLETMERFGIRVRTSEDFTEFHVSGRQHYVGGSYEVEGDWSAGAFLLVLAALLKLDGVDVRILNLSPSSLQADRAVLNVLERAGVRVKFENGAFSIDRVESMNGFEFDFTDCPDLVPPLVPLAVFCRGRTHMYGVKRLRFKESNRLQALGRLLDAVGVRYEISDDSFIIDGLGPNVLPQEDQIEVDSHNDHRIAMAATLIGLRRRGGISITNASCVAKSFPSFYKVVEMVLKELNGVAG